MPRPVAVLALHKRCPAPTIGLSGNGMACVDGTGGFGGVAARTGVATAVKSKAAVRHSAWAEIVMGRA